MGTFATEEACAAAVPNDAHGVAVTRRDGVEGEGRGCGDLRLGRRAEVGQGPYEHRPERGLLRLRKDLQLYANLRPAVTYPALADASSLKSELVEGLDIMILRELTGGVYFGEPKTITDLGNGQKRAVDTQVYDTYEIERSRASPFELARKAGRNKVTSMDKRNVMRPACCGRGRHAGAQPRIPGRAAEEQCWPIPVACSLCASPKQFDVIVTDNLFGDMLSDIAAMLTGSLGMLPQLRSARSIRRPRSARRCTAGAWLGPDMPAGVANPIAMNRVVRDGGCAIRSGC